MSHTDSFQFFGLFVVVHQHNRNFLILRFLMCDKMLKREKKTRLDGAAVAAVSTTGAHARAELEKDYAFLVTCDTFSLAVVFFDRTPSAINSLSHQKEATVSRQHYFFDWRPCTHHRIQSRHIVDIKKKTKVSHDSSEAITHSISARSLPSTWKI